VKPDKPKRKPAAPPPWLAALNPEQRRAVTHGDGPLLVVAGAGSGKTRTLACRVAYLIDQGVAPGRILLLTFTRRAAEEMLKRAAAMIAGGRNPAGRVWGGTFHAIANRLLRLHARATGLDPDFTVMDQADAQDMLNVIRHELGLHRTAKRFPKKATCLAIYSRCVNGSAPPADVLARHFPWCAEWETELKMLFKRYTAQKLEQHVLDYDDLLLYWAELLRDPAAARRVGGRFDWILVDEYQDTNTVQAAILEGMRRDNPNVMVVGDDAQSIYSFRAATVRNMLDFPKRFPGTTRVTLEQNYRSVVPILDVTNRVIAQAAERYTKDLWSARPAGQRPRLAVCKDEAQQDTYVVDCILRHYEQGIALRNQAVLFRAAHLSASLEIELTRRAIPYHKYGGLRFLEAAHIKDLIAFLRVAENPRDAMAWFRVLQLLDGVGPATASRIMQHVAAEGYRLAALDTAPCPEPVRPAVAGIGALLRDLAGHGRLNPAAQVERVRRAYDPILRKRYDAVPARQRDLESLEHIASGYRSRRAFLTDLQLDPPTSTGDLAGPPAKDDDWLVLSTIHSAKGCEWDVVCLIHASDGCLPSDMATGSDEEIEEERRLMYVAMTRAKDYLYVTWPLRYYHRWSRFGDRHSYAQPSRFLTDDVRALMDTAEPAQDEDDADAADTADGGEPIAARLLSRWE
jgi:DNA helicase II / ATP-dependent DNA helicase PcrA